MKEAILAAALAVGPLQAPAPQPAEPTLRVEPVGAEAAPWFYRGAALVVIGVGGAVAIESAGEGTDSGARMWGTVVTQAGVGLIAYGWSQLYR